MRTKSVVSAVVKDKNKIRNERILKECFRLLLVIMVKLLSGEKPILFNKHWLFSFILYKLSMFYNN